MVRRLAALILPAALQDAGNQLAIAMGHDELPGNTYNVPLQPIGEASEPTHFGTSTLVTPGFEAIILEAQQGNYPDWPPEMISLAQTVIAGLIADFTDNEASASEHFDSVAAANGLERYAEVIG
jgi:hypothetical protein